MNQGHLLTGVIGSRRSGQSASAFDPYDKIVLVAIIAGVVCTWKKEGFRQQHARAAPASRQQSITQPV